MKITVTRKSEQKNTHRVVELSTLLKSFKKERQSEPVGDVRYELKIMGPGGATPISLHRLSRIHFAAHFRRTKDGTSFAGYNGIVLLTIGNLSGIKEAGYVRNKVIRFPPCIASFVGSSGRSVKVLVRFTRPDGSLPGSETEAELFHAHAYRWAVNYFRAQLPDYTIRLQKPSLHGYCRYTYDPGLQYKEPVYPIFLEQPLSMPGERTYREVQKSETDPLSRMVPGIERYRIVSLLFETSLTRALEEEPPGAEKEREKSFLETLAGYCFSSGIPQQEATTWTVNRFHREIEAPLIRQTFGNVYKIRKRFGEKPCLGSKQMLYLQTEEFMNRCYEFRYNMQTSAVEYREKNTFFFDFRPITDRVLNSIAVKAMSEGIDLWDKDVRRWIHSDKVPVYNPIEDYMYHLPEWDDKDRIRAFARRVPCNNPHWPDLFYRWFLGMVAQWIGYNKRHANAVAPVLVGTQGCGKSTFCRTLLPPELHAYYTDRIDFTLKRDAELYLNRFALINMDEFDQISPKDQSFLKHILQKPVVNTRKPHQTTIQELRRYASFIGTSNHSDLLTDTSGSRRFICIQVTGTIDNLSPVDYYQLYAQAFESLQAGVTHWFTPEEEAKMMLHNQEFEVRTPAEQLFLQYFRAPEAGESYRKMMAVEIFEEIQKKSGVKLTQTTIIGFGRVLKKLEIPSQKSKNNNYYLVVNRE